jgi:iron complex outermembrane receptor protein
MKKSIGALFIMTILGSPIYPGALSAEEDYKTYTLGEILVLAERAGVKNVAINTEITAEDISATNSRTVAEALQYIPGVQVTMGRKMEASISIHGFSQDKALILIDGVPYYETKYGKFDMNQISIENVARIDVIKGAASVLYGANAEAGVINIITKKAADRASFSGRLEAGRDGAASAYLSHGMKKGSLSYWISYMRRQWDGWKLSDDFTPRAGVVQTGAGRRAVRVDTLIEDGGLRGNSDFRADNVYVKLGLEPSADAEYFLNLHYSATEKGDPPNIDLVKIFPDRPAFSTFDRIETYDNWGADLSGRKKLTHAFGLMGKLFYHNHIDDYVSYSDASFDTAIATSRYQDYIAGGMAIGDYTLAGWNVLRGAVNFRLDSHEQRDDEYLPFEKSASYTGSLGLEDELTLLDSKLSVVAGVGYDWFDVKEAETNETDDDGNFVRQVAAAIPETMTEINPMLGASFLLNDKTRLFASVARKTRFPTLSELFGSSGNIDLESERSINYTAGISMVVSKMLSFEVSPFYHDVSDRISRDFPSPDELYYNVAEIEMLGIEINADMDPVKSLSFNVGYTYIEAEDVSPGRVTENVTDVPEYKLDARLEYTAPTLGSRIALTVAKYGDSFSQLPTATDWEAEVVANEGYAVFGAKFSQPFLAKWEAYLTVSNLSDENYEPESGYPAQGRTFWLGVSYKY